jgi:hypothetical protein
MDDFIDTTARKKFQRKSFFQRNVEKARERPAGFLSGGRDRPVDCVR